MLLFFNEILHLLATRFEVQNAYRSESQFDLSDPHTQLCPRGHCSVMAINSLPQETWFPVTTGRYMVSEQ